MKECSSSLIYVLLFPRRVLVASIASRPRLQAAFGVDDVNKCFKHIFRTSHYLWHLILVLVYLFFITTGVLEIDSPAGQARDNKWFCGYCWIPLSGILTAIDAEVCATPVHILCDIFTVNHALANI